MITNHFTDTYLCDEANIKDLIALTHNKQIDRRRKTFHVSSV